MGLGCFFNKEMAITYTSVPTSFFFFFFLNFFQTQVVKSPAQNESPSYTGPISKVRSNSLVRVYKVFDQLFMARHAKASSISKQRFPNTMKRTNEAWGDQPWLCTYATKQRMFELQNGERPNKGSTISISATISQCRHDSIQSMCSALKG